MNPYGRPPDQSKNAQTPPGRDLASSKWSKKERPPITLVKVQFPDKDGDDLSMSDNSVSRSKTASSSQAAPGLFGSTTQAPSTGGNPGGPFGGAGAATTQPQLGGSLFGQNTSQPPAPSPFGSTLATPQPAPSLFSQPATSQPASNVFGQPATSQPASNVFGQPATSQPASNVSGQPATSQPASNVFSQPATSKPASSFFGQTLTSQPLGQTSQPSPFSGLGQTSQPATSGSTLFSTTSTTPQSTSLFPPAQPNSQSLFQKPGNPPAATNNPLFTRSTFNTNPGGAAPPSLGSINTSNATGAKIDLEHLRPTTKYDQLTDGLQSDIAALDTFILSQIQMAHEVADLLPAIASAGSTLPQDVGFVGQKLEEVETGLENDAEEIVALREGVVKKDAVEARLCFRNVDRLKMPQQYQTSAASSGVTGGFYGGSGLSGWWNHPQTLQRSLRGANGADGSRSLSLPGDEDGDGSSGGPASLVDLFERRADEMKTTIESHKELLQEIEAFVGGVEMKIFTKERELQDDRSEPQDQVKMLRYVFGTVEKSLYDVADKVGGARDGVQELVMSAGDERKLRSSRLGW